MGRLDDRVAVICVNAIAPGGIPATMYPPGTAVDLPPTAETLTERALYDAVSR